ncbi:MAG TPA: SLC13 family permease [Anaerolineales bacterium]|nr:SLC13 family permease [Anaerolineales bacterium]
MSPAVVAGLIFGLAIGLILTDRLDRTIIALVGAVAMIAAGTWLGFYSQEQAIQAVDFETLGLLLGMMILISLLKPTGAFEALALAAARASRGRPAVLLVSLGLVTTVLSMLLDNVTTVVLVVPLTILVSEILALSPAPFLIAEALLSDTGGVGTLIGDPPNILIASAAGFTFQDFLTHTLPVVILAWAATLGLLLLLFRRELSVSPTEPEALANLQPRQALRDPRGAWQVAAVLVGAIVLFFLAPTLHLTNSLIALGAAGLALAWVRPKVDETLRGVEWSVLVFFASLFVIVGGLQGAGVLQALGEAVVPIFQGEPVLASVGMIWFVAVLSAVIDNVPVTIAFIPVITYLGSTGVNPLPLWWAMAFGAGFGGNATIIGSAANVVVVQYSRQTREPISSKLWTRRGLPVMALTCLLASLAMAVAHSHFAR